MTADERPIEERPITDQRVLAAVNELEDLVRSHYPEATSGYGTQAR